MQRTYAAAVLGVALLFAPGWCFGQTANIQPISYQDHFRHPQKEKSYTESWNYHFMLDSGETLSFSFLISNLGLASGSATAQLTLSSPHSDPVSVRDEHGGKSDFNEDRKTGTISIGEQSIEHKDMLTRIRFSKNGAKADLTLHPWFAGFKVGDGKTIVDREKGGFYRTFIEIPRCDLEGTLTLNGSTRSIRGAGYMDHTVSNVLPTSYSRYWYSLRAFFPEHTVVIIEFQYAPGLGGGRWTLGYAADRNGLLGVSTDCEVDKSGAFTSRHCTAPTRFAVRMNSGDMKVEGTFSSPELYCCAPVLGDSGWLVQKLASSLVGNMVVCRFRSQADLHLTTSSRTVHLEGPAYQGVVKMGD